MRVDARYGAMPSCACCRLSERGEGLLDGTVDDDG